MKSDKTWLKTRQQLLQQLKTQVALRLGPPTRELRLYTKRFQAQFPKRWRESSKTFLIDRMSEADFVFGSDFHAFSQAQRVHLRLLREVVGHRTVALCCEFLEVRHQKWVDRLQKGEISEAQFLRQTKWQERWGFPWDAYSPLLEFARQHQIEVIALNHIGPRYGLKKRDEKAGVLLARHFQRHPDRLHYVVFGELHLAEQHLPRETKKALRAKNLNAVFLYQDEEDSYFRLARQGREGRVDVLQAPGNRFCILGAPPWVKWQSYAMYLEHTFDRDLDDGDLPLDLSDQFHAMVKLLSDDLQLTAPTDSVTVYSSRQPQMWRELKSQLTPRELKLVRLLVESDRSFYLPESHVAYISRPSVNHVADVAGRFIHAYWGGVGRLLGRMPTDFSALIWVEAVGFFASKLINHKRAAETLADLKAQLGALQPGPSQAREVLALALDQRMKEIFRVRGLKRQNAKSFRPRRKESYLEAARLLGAMMGERLYQSYRHNWLSKQNLLSWLQQDVTSDDFANLYLEIVRRLEPGERLGKTRAERL